MFLLYLCFMFASSCKRGISRLVTLQERQLELTETNILRYGQTRETRKDVSFQLLTVCNRRKTDTSIFYILYVLFYYAINNNVKRARTVT